MKHKQKSSILYVLFFVLVCTGVHAQQFDIDEFHIPDGLDLSSSEYKRLQNTGTQIREKLVTNLQAQGYDVISPRKSKIRLQRVGIDDIRVDYDPEAERVIFGKLVKTIDYVAIYAYLYDATHPIRSFDVPLEEFVLNRKASQLNDPEEISTAVSEIITGLSLDRSAELQEAKRLEEELKQKEELARQEKLKREELERQKELEEKLAQEKKLKQKGEDPRQKISKENEEKLALKDELKELAQLKKLEQKRLKEERKSTKVCSKVPGIALVVGGGLMGGAGLYLRIKAKNIYDNDYVPHYNEPDARDVLEDARRPNRMAHIIGATGILTAGIGSYLWAKCSKKQKNSNLDASNLQITPHIEYNAITNTNHVAARISFNF